MVGDYTSICLFRLIMMGDYTSMYLIRLIMMGDYTSIYLFRLIMMGGSIGCGLLLSVVNYWYLLWFVCSAIAFYIPSARFFPLPSSQKERVTPILHSSFFIFHSTFFILHSSFKKSPSVGRVTARYLVNILLFPLTHINEKANNAYFSKKNPQKFW